jgi:hypothetical protein
MFLRVCAGVIGILLSVTLLIGLWNEELPSLSGKYALLMPFLGFAFIAYAIGGQKLLKKFLPNLAEQDKNLTD